MLTASDFIERVVVASEYHNIIVAHALNKVLNAWLVARVHALFEQRGFDLDGFLPAVCQALNFDYRISYACIYIAPVECNKLRCEVCGTAIAQRTGCTARGDEKLIHSCSFLS